MEISEEFKEAITALDKGLRIRRFDWPEEARIRAGPKGELRLITIFGTRPWCPSLEDFKSSDWVILD